MTVKQFFKNAGKAIVVFLATLGACFSMIFVLGSIIRSKDHKTTSSPDKIKKETEEEIEKTSASELVNNSGNAELHGSTKDRLKQKFDSRVDSIVEAFLGK